MSPNCVSLLYDLVIKTRHCVRLIIIWETAFKNDFIFTFLKLRRILLGTGVWIPAFLGLYVNNLFLVFVQIQSCLFYVKKTQMNVFDIRQ